jgi:SagB-type dehydrogenase family enzyme
MSQDRTAQHREFLTDRLRLQIDFSQTDQSRGLSPPPVELPFDEEATRIPLPAPTSWEGVAAVELSEAISRRESQRRYTNEPLSKDELAYLLWATQGVRRPLGPGHALRTVPSAGCRHAFETYVCATRVEGLEVGVYRYLPLEHELLLVRVEPDLSRLLIEGALGQRMCGLGAATFVWTAVPYRMEWRYGLAAHRVILIDAGHVCQNLYLATQAVGAGCCAVAAFHQDGMDDLLGVDGQDEFTIYLAPVGKLA